MATTHMRILDFNRRKRLERLARELGSFDEMMSREELLQLRADGEGARGSSPGAAAGRE